MDSLSRAAIYDRLSTPVTSIIFSFQYGRDMFSQKRVSKSVKAAIEYTGLMKQLRVRGDSTCINGLFWSEYAFDAKGEPERGFVFGSCEKLVSESNCSLCGVFGNHRKCSVSLRATFCDVCGFKISPEQTSKNVIRSTGQKIEFPTDIITNKTVRMCYFDSDHSCEGDCTDDCIGDDGDQASFSGQQIFDMMNN